MKAHYRTVVVETTCEPLDIAAEVASSGIFETYMVHESSEGWSIAGGVAAEVILSADRLRCTEFGESREERWHGDPLRQVQDFLARLHIADWSAYGWSAFELAHAIAGMAVDPGVLLHLVVPETEILLSESRMVVRGLDSASLADVEVALDRIQANVTAHRMDPAERRQQVPVDLEKGAEVYRNGVASLVGDIRSGKLQKAILSRRVPVEAEVDFPASYRKGRRENTPARSFLLDMGGLRCFGFSPETVVEVSPGRRVVSQPLAGTRALTGDADVDRKLREELISDPKELHEHAISVKVAVDELAGPCALESVVVEEYMTVKERGSVQHLASRVAGRMPEGCTPWDAFSAVFPAVTASGVPKHAAYEAIRGYEQFRRGPYAGAVLKVTEAGAMDAALVLRSVYAQDGQAWLQAGAGIVEHSRPERELEETREKLRCVALSVLAPAEGPADAAALVGSGHAGHVR
ncbi:salicylate synthase [Streptomyces sp. NPDC087300]|uniref:salicylate synthase n=1 Tax=Streptomyces sp. NPDC087300 TaxID=3365780 RepID=UPI00382C1452